MTAFLPTTEDIERVKFFRQLEFSLREEARRKQKQIDQLKEENTFAKYVLEVFDEELKNSQDISLDTVDSAALPKNTS